MGALLLLANAAAYAQFYPVPGSSTASPVLCNGCPGFNRSGQSNAGLPTYPYATPIKAHVGRYIDSVNTSDWQASSLGGFRTARAARVVVAPTQRGSAPPRIYMQIGSALAAYSIDTFFTTRLPGGMVSSSAAFIPDPRHEEKVLAPDAFVYPEPANSGWKTYTVDGQDRLFDIDFDDRGYVYAAFSIWGWGIIRDDGRTTGGGLPKVQQVVDSLPEGCNPLSVGSCTTLRIPSITVKGLTVVKGGTSYYVLIYNPEQAGEVAIYNVTNPDVQIATPGVTNRRNQAIRVAAKSRAADKLAFVDVDNKVQIYDSATYVTGGGPLVSFNPSPGRQFVGISADDEGNFWAIEDSPPGGSLSTNVLWKFTLSGGSYTASSFNVYGEAYAPQGIRVSDGYIAIYGLEAGPNTQVYDARLFKISNGSPTAIDLKEFFRNYYHYPPQNYAMPEGYTNLPRAFVPVKVGSKVYVIYADHGLGDVYEIQGGDTVTASSTGSFGTANPNSKATQVGPFYGDPITFNSAAVNPGFPLNVTWNFGNPEAGAANTATARTGDPVTYQYRALSTVAQISTAKTAKVALTTDASSSDTVNVTHKVPTPRVVIVPPTGVSTLLTEGATLLPEDKFGDGSDGSIEGHFSTFVVGDAVGASPVTTSVNPAGVVTVGALGGHRVSFTATYGPYNSSLVSLATPSYAAQLGPFNYSVKPFVISPVSAIASGNTVTFKATARKTTDTTILLPTAVTWSVTWSLKNASNIDIIAPVTTAAAPIGTIPDFVIANKNVIVNGATAAVSVTIPTAVLSTAAAAFASSSSAQVQVIPDPVLNKSGCENTGAACTWTATSGSAASTAGWTYSWTLAGPAPASANTASFTPSLSQPGSYTVTLVVTNGVFETSNSQNFSVSGPVCGPLPTAGSMGVTIRGLTSGCTGTGLSPCAVGEAIELRAQGWPYIVQACDQFSWTFGDGGTGSGQVVQHTYSGAGPYTASFTISNTSGGQPVTFSAPITFGNGNPNPGGCTAPSAATITVQGSQGCNGTSILPCKTGETIVFYAARQFGTALQSCDVVSWSFSDGFGSSQSSIQRTFNSAVTVVVNLSVSNVAAPALTLSIQGAVTNPGGCATPGNIDFTYQGLTTGCASTGSTQCQRGETLQFNATGFGYTYQSCDQFEWTFGDGGTSAEKNPTHVFNGGAQGYEVTLKVINTSGQKTASRTIRLAGRLDAKPVPTVSVSASSDKVGKNAVVTFTAAADRESTGWTWNFGDGQTDVSHTGDRGTTNIVQHGFSTPGPYVVTCRARNADDIPESESGTGTKQIEVTNVPEHRFLLPVVTRSAGFAGSTWRTDVQVFNPDPTVSASNPLVLNMTFRGRTKTASYQLDITTSTFISEDFMKYFADGDESGSVTISVPANYQPQIWTRTYNQAASGTYGQFIPAILLSGDGGSATALPTVATDQFIPGLRTGGKYRTNVGLVNPMDRALTITVTAYNDAYDFIGSTQKIVQPFELKQFLIDADIAGIPTEKPFMVKIAVPANAWLIAYASMIDQVSQDPTYIGAVFDNDVSSVDFKDIVVPGVGRTGLWRSDVTIFNPDFERTTFDLAYYNQEGVLSGEAKNLTLKGRNFLQLDDLLKAGYLAPAPGDGVGALRIRTTGDVRRFPIAHSRTYNYDGVRSFGQGIPAFAIGRGNVKPNKPAYIAAVRNENGYYTNIGLVNLSDQNVTVRVTLLRSDTGAAAESRTYDLKPYQSTVGNILAALGNAARGSLKVSIEGSTGSVWAFASVIDNRTGDPEYLAGVPTP